MDEQREWLNKRRKKRLRILAALLCFSVLSVGFPGILDALSAYAALPDEGWNQTALQGTAQAGLSLPDALEEALTETAGEGSENTIAGESAPEPPVAEGAGEEKAPENPASKEPTTGEPVPEPPTLKEPAAETPTPENPALKEPAAETPMPENPTPEAPAPEETVPGNPAPETPVLDKPATDEPVSEKPSLEKPAEEQKPEASAPEGATGEEPVSETPVPEETKPEESLVTEKPAKVISDEKKAAPAEDTPQTFTVTFYDDDGAMLTNPGPIKVTSGGKASEPSVKPEKTGYVFKEWMTESGGGGTAFDFGKAITENTSVYASWEAKTVKVTFNFQPGDGGTQAVTYGTSYGSSLPPNPSKEGHLFNGWNTEGSGKGEWISAGSIVTKAEDHVIYACWAADTADADFHITYDLAGGAFPKGTKPKETYKRTTSDFKLPTPKREGYIFDGWSGTELSGLNTSVTVRKGSAGGRFYTANWKAATYSVTFSYNGATSHHSEGKKTVTYGEAYGSLPAPEKKGYTFEGWYIDPELKGGLVRENTIVRTAKAHSLYARWKNPNGTYTVTLKSDKGYKLKPKSGSVNPVKEGNSYTFVFDLKEGYRKKDDFSVLVNGRRVKLSSKDEYTIDFIYEDKVVTVEGVEKKTSGEETPEAPAENQSGDGGSSYSAVTPAAPAPKKPAAVSPADNSPAPAVSPESPAVPETAKSGDKPSSKSKTTAKNSGSWKKKTTESSESESYMEEPANDPQPEVRGADVVEEPKTETETDGKTRESEGYSGGEVIQSLPAAVEEGRIVVSGEPVSAGNVSGMLGSVAGVKGAGTSLTLGSGSVTVKVVCEAAGCKAGVTDAVSVANAVLTAEQIKQAQAGENMEIRIDVTDISGTVTQQDRNVVADCIEDFGEELPGLAVGMYADISVYTRNGGGEWNAVTDTDDAIGMVIGIPENLPRDDVEYYIIRAHDGGYSLLSDRDEVPDTITVSTDRFSSYAIAYRELGVSGTAEGRTCSLCHICPTFFGSCCFLWLALATAVCCVIGLLLAFLLSGKGERSRENTVNVGTDGKNMCRMYK